MSYLYKGKNYLLSVTEDRFTVKCEGEEICSLIPTTAVETVTEADGVFTDHKDLLETLTSFAKKEDGIFQWTAKSSLWEKTYTLTCDPDGFTYSVTAKGSGSIGQICYFADGSSLAETRDLLTEKDRHSTYEFYEYFTPNPSAHPRNTHVRPSGASFPSSYELLIPPPYVYSFRTWDVSSRFGLGLIAEEGQYNFTKYDYLLRKRGEQMFFYLSTDLEGHTKVDGEFTLPAIRAFFGKDDMDIVKKYCDYHFDTGLCRRKERKDMPRWWYGPIVCGWHEQYAQIKDDNDWNSYATQEVYEHIADEIEKHNLRPTILIIDDKWQETYGGAMPDPKKWPDMRAFTDKMHAKGIHTLLWFRMWGAEGLPDDEVIKMPLETDRWGEGKYADPTSEAYKKHLREILYRLLSSDEGCMNCDGLKLDFFLVMPYGKEAKSKGGQYGAELTKILHTMVYEIAKEIKPDCLINSSPAHPYFDEVCDQARLHDCSWETRDQCARMTERAEIFSAAMPDVLIDTDTTNYASHSEAMRYLRHQPKIGIPDIYQFSNTLHITLTDEDWREIEKIFNDYSDEMDKLFEGKNK